MDDMKVQDVMTHLVVTFRPEDTIRQAAARLVGNRISGAPVVEGGRLVGIVSEADLVPALAHPALGTAALGAPDAMSFLLRGVVLPPDTSTTVAGVMTTRVITVSPESSVWEAAALIDRHGIRRLPVVDADGYVVGIIARADLVRSMAGGDAAVTWSAGSRKEVVA